MNMCAVFWFWVIIATIWAMYGGFSLVLWYYTRSGMSALSAALSFWMFVITSSISILIATPDPAPGGFFFALQRAAWVPAVLIYWFIIDMGLRHGNGRLTKLRHIWRPWTRSKHND